VIGGCAVLLVIIGGIYIKLRRPQPSARETEPLECGNIMTELVSPPEVDILVLGGRLGNEPSLTKEDLGSARFGKLRPN
jgi:hypothetical protein